MKVFLTPKKRIKKATNKFKSISKWNIFSYFSNAFWEDIEMYTLGKYYANVEYLLCRSTCIFFPAFNFCYKKDNIVDL